MLELSNVISSLELIFWLMVLIKELRCHYYFSGLDSPPGHVSWFIDFFVALKAHKNRYHKILIINVFCCCSVFVYISYICEQGSKTTSTLD